MWLYIKQYPFKFFSTDHLGLSWGLLPSNLSLSPIIITGLLLHYYIVVTSWVPRSVFTLYSHSPTTPRSLLIATRPPKIPPQQTPTHPPSPPLRLPPIQEAEERARRGWREGSRLFWRWRDVGAAVLGRRPAAERRRRRGGGDVRVAVEPGAAGAGVRGAVRGARVGVPRLPLRVPHPVRLSLFLSFCILAISHGCGFVLFFFCLFHGFLVVLGGRWVARGCGRMI